MWGSWITLNYSGLACVADIFIDPTNIYTSLRKQPKIMNCSTLVSSLISFLSAAKDRKQSIVILTYIHKHRPINYVI